MKKLFRILMAAAVLLTASCAKEEISATIGGGEVEVTFTANLAGLGTRAIADGNTVDRVYLAIFDAKSDTYLGELTADAGYPVSNGLATIPVVLLKDKEYDLVFWAQKDGTGAYTLDLEHRKVKANYGAAANNEARDAFFNISNDWTAGKDATTFELRRPFAQINVGNSDADVKYAKQNGSEIKQSAMTVTTKVYDTIELVNGSLTGTQVSAEFTIAAIPTETVKGTVDPTHDAVLNASEEYNYLAMNYLLVNDRQLVDLVFNFTDGATNFERKYFQVPVQRNYRTNILGQIISSPMDFNVEIVPGFDGEENPDISIVTFNDVDTDAELLTALTVSEDHVKKIIVNLTGDVTYDVAAWANKAMGGNNTKEIIINGSKSRAADEYYTLTFNNTDSDWNNIVTNGAKLILESLNITNSGYGATDAPWNRHDLNFACDVEMNNVVSLNAIALKANAKIENTTINDDHTGSSYAVWIQPNGQTVTIDNCTIDATGAGDGRGIKIDEQYVDAPEKVILNVSNTKFVTESKAAILVKSAAGAEVNASNLDIAGVAADTVYAVWVDEDAAAYYDLVEVTGAQVRLEGSAVVSTQQEFEAALKAGKTQINLAAANFTIPTQFNTAGLTNGTTVTLIGAGEATVLSFNSVAGGADGGLNSYADGLNLVFKNMAVVSPNTGSAYTGGFGRALSATFTNCKYYGQYRAVNANTKFEKCTIDPQTSYIYTDYANADFVDCVFNCSKGKAIQVYNDGASTNTTINVKNCQFTAAEIGYTWDNKPVTAIDINSNGEIFTVNINSSTATGFGVGLQSGNSLHNIKGGANYITIYVDGVCVHEPAPVADANGNYSVKSEEGLEKALQNIENGKSISLAEGTYVIPAAAQGKTVTFVNNGNVEDVKVAVTKVGVGGENCDYGLDGSTVTFENITITTNSSTYIGYARCNGTYKNCVINGTYTLYGNSVFEDCTFNVSGDVYNIWTWGAPTATFTRCTFNCDGKAVLLYGTVNTKLTVNNCTFNDKGGLTDLKAAIEIGNDYNKSYELIVNNATVNGFEINDKGINTGTTLWANKNSMPQDKLNVVVDGVDVY